ncbi:MAG: glycosidase [Candidatus Omnitrophica bacterium]|nr:glycosidase [Candidatus Omnitrophota bacterium]
MVLKRYSGNPILTPKSTNPWESVMVYNCGAIYEKNTVHLIYRAQGSKSGISRFGYASSKNGFTIERRSSSPIFCPDPASDLEQFGVEDPRITKIGDRIYMCYTAYGTNMGMVTARKRYQVGMVSISVNDFLDRKWNWSSRLYPFHMSENKNSFLFPEKIKNNYVLIHRTSPNICISFSRDGINWPEQRILMKPRLWWEHYKIGGSAPPIKTEKGWLLIYHGVDASLCYRLGIALLSLDDPTRVIKISNKPFMTPDTKYEREGVVPNVVFSCGAVVIRDKLFLYYGGADTVVCVATAKIREIFNFLGS